MIKNNIINDQAIIYTDEIKGGATFVIIIGEKINGTIPSVKKAIDTKDAAFIQNLALRQAEAGTDYIDVCAGTIPEKEAETLEWLIDLVQEAVDVPLSIDSPNADIIKQVFNRVKHPGLINSVSDEGDKCDVLFPIVKGTNWDIVALTCDNRGIPVDVQTRVDITKKIVEKAISYDIDPSRIHVDPLVMTLSTDNESFKRFVGTLRAVKEIYPSIKVTSGLSNISFGMPLRKVVNQNFLALALYEGMDSAIMDPLNRDMMATMLAVEALMGRDRHCRKFSNAYRKNKIGPLKNK